jgi:hypothetical protein
MKFPILLKTGSFRYHLICQLIQKDQKKEQYRIYPKNNPGKFLTIENNRPLIRGRYSKTRRIDWKLTEGRSLKPSVLDRLINIIQNKIEPLPPGKPEFGLDLDFESTSPSDRKKNRSSGPGWGERNNNEEGGNDLLE